MTIFFYTPKVTISVDTPSPVITADGQPKSRGFKLPTGQHTIRVSSSGFVPYEFSGLLRPFQRLNLKLTLRPLPSAKSLVTEAAFAASFSADGKKFYYLGNGGKTLYQIEIVTDKASKEKRLERTAITPDLLPALKSIIFAPDFQVAVFKRQDGDTGLYDFKRYDLLHQEYQSWGNDVGDVVWTPDGQNVVYYYAPQNGERSLILTNRQRQDLHRIIDLRTIGVDFEVGSSAAPRLTISRDGKLISMTTQGRLIIVSVTTGVATELASGGITDAVFGPDSRYIAYSQNGILKWQVSEPVNAMSGKAEDEANVGRIRSADAKDLKITASASKSVYTKDGGRMIVVTSDGLKEIDLKTLKVKPFYLKDKIATVNDLGLSDDGLSLYVLSGSKILAVPLDSGDYQNKKTK